MLVDDLAYIAGMGEGQRYPLSEFLPQYPVNIFSTWIEQNNLAQHVFIDPINASPHLPVELAAQGYRMLCSRSNPIIWLMAEVMCSSHVQEMIRQTVNKLLVSRYDAGSLEEHLQGMYVTRCSGCGKMIQPEGFVWEKGADLPLSRVYTCPHCGDSGEREITADDIKNLRGLGNVEIYRSRARQRVGADDDYQSRSIAAALDCYLPRSLYVCMLLVTRFEIMALEKDQAKFLRAALLTLFNDAHVLRHWPLREYRFLQFAVPQRFFEKNLYQSLISVQDRWPVPSKTIPVTYWPNLPGNDGGICFYQRKLAENKDLLPSGENHAVAAIFPRPGRAFWTFSALWAGWLWGKKSVKPLRSALSRQRYDWYWYARAIFSSMRRVTRSINPSVRMFGLFPDYSPSLFFGLAAGMQKAGFQMKGAAFREKESLLQGEWDYAENDLSGVDEKKEIDEILRDFLNGMGEPVDFNQLIMQVIKHRMQVEKPSSDDLEFDEQDFSRLNNLINQSITRSGLVTTFTPEKQGTSRFWLVNESHSMPPLAERVEQYILQILRSSDHISCLSVDRLVCQRFPGAFTPPSELVSGIIAAYAQIDPGGRVCKLHAHESLNQRSRDAVDIRERIRAAGIRVGLAVPDGDDLCWQHPDTGKILFDFTIINSADIADSLFKPSRFEFSAHIIVYPASRAGLINYRMQNDPRMNEAMKDGWHFVKYRHIRRLADDQELTRTSWDEQLDADPPLREAPVQLQMM